MLITGKCGVQYYRGMILVTKTYLPDKAKYQAYVDCIFKEGWLTNDGAMVRKLEERLAAFLGVPYLVLTANGTLALQVAAKLLDLSGEVITTPFSFVATASSLVWEGLQPRFADIDARTLNMDPDKVEALITDQTSAILPVHTFGNLCHPETIDAIAKKHGLKVIYDAAHAFGTSWEGIPCGTFGDVSAFSFHSTKLFHTIEGGAIALPSEEMYRKARLLINFGIAGPERVDSLGINAKMNEFEAAMGLCVLDDVELIIQGRKEVSERYMEAFGAETELSFPSALPGSTPNYSYFPVLFRDEQHMLKVKRAMEAEDIYPRRYFYPSFSGLPYLTDADPTPISDQVAQRILCLPLYHDLPLTDQERIIEILQKHLR